MPLVTQSMEKKMSEKICSLCSFYDSSQDEAGENDERSGYCRFNAPKIFDNKKTVSGVSRGKQRMIYDQRRRDVLPENGITLIELDYSEFAHTSSKRLTRDRQNDLSIIRERLLNYIKN